MKLIRIEAAPDPVTGAYALQIFWPHDAEQPYVTTPARYQSEAAAENDFIAMLGAGYGGAATTGRPQP